MEFWNHELSTLSRSYQISVLLLLSPSGNVSSSRMNERATEWAFQPVSFRLGASESWLPSLHCFLCSS
ncbi:hypothetical protein N658DRAFT_52347 [Parathielavia hyrcaniae]|uniref:Uncharacterized protein n=1 Tax=Parathielavia hyrcaniae TaxID=113614 RepID=A0AAN6T1J4_9PEZI|nr:hypothetical protein N658DRAFT_52347 [Parathielavia hyrcaniae]